MLFRKSMIVLILGLVVASVVIQLLREGEEFDAPEAKTAALSWVGSGKAEAPRREGDNWEVDVRRPDGSLVQVTISDDLELRDFDEESGPAGRLASDELVGRPRERAIEAAYFHVGPGRVVGVERDPNGEIEVGMRLGQDQIEVRLDERYRVLDVIPEDPGDE
jgi:hypothetical protein